MLQIQKIRENKALVIDYLKKRNKDFGNEIDQIIEWDIEKRKNQVELEQAQSELNDFSKKIGELFKSGEREKANELKVKTGNLKDQISEKKDIEHNLALKINELLYQIPNVPHPSVPEGKLDTDNEVVSEEGNIPDLKDQKLPHWDLTSKHGLIDFELGVKITGAGFPLYTNKGAKLQRALINFFLDEAEKAGYNEMIPPLVVNQKSGTATGQLPDKEGQMYQIINEDLYLIPTAEVPLTNIFRDTLVKEADFPIKLCGYTPCFRREAGSYGKDVRGLNRLHQFDKVEIIQIEHPEKSYDTLMQMLEHSKNLLRKLELPFRVLRLCGGDLGFTSALTYDLEVYSAAQERWLEVSSVSNFETYQSNRLKVRYKDKSGKSQLAHTLNGSALALPRIVAALLENNQTADGIRIPEALVPYTKFDIIN